VSKFELPETQFEETKLPVKPTWSTKITVLSTFLESSLNFLFNNLKNIQNLVQIRRKVVSKFELPETQFEDTKLPVKPSWSKKMTVLSTFLEFSLNFLVYNLKKPYKN